ncbi:MAG: hypothetical protein PVS3B3_33130 [Ktedonobacteraceae bacterium]
MYTGSIFPVPIVAAILTTAVYISPLPQQVFNSVPWIASGWIAIALGTFITLLLWVVLSLPFKGMTTFENANPISSNHLKSHVSALKAGFEVLRQKRSATMNRFREDPSLQGEQSDHFDLCLEKVRVYLLAIDEELARGGLTWIAGAGYVNAWNLVHRAEEAMMDIAPRKEVLREALHDEFSLKGSALDARNSALAALRTAVQTLSPSAAVYLDSPPQPTGNGAAEGKRTTDNSHVSSTGEYPSTEMEAREAFHTVKQTLNEFRDSMWEGLVRIRNQLVGTAFITAMLTYVLLDIVIAAGVLASSLKAAIIFYLVGAMVGLFSRLYQESQADPAVDDYGLATARAVVTPLLSGLAALAGVFLVAILSLTLLRSPSPASSSLTTALPDLANIYNLDRNTMGIVVAAIFGLTPNLLISTLQQQGEQFKTQLKNSSAPDQGKP